MCARHVGVCDSSYWIAFWVATNVVPKQCWICESEACVMKSGTCVFNYINLMGNVAIDLHWVRALAVPMHLGLMALHAL